ncbi:MULTISPECIES: LysE family translocator [Burkholderia]|uniref:LysE family translocator n=1 Tax=Burkholderia TaxID=32008 RepID=UPI000F5AC6CF|nr:MULTISPECIES: LysE family translocator [Burkholderia]MCW3641389.1 LysE family translocator [Burkholderia cenocepacia]RQU61179.1 LysE family translocator [Burkholderia cenocepacia]RQV33297.1 LysE family translocator [Burkholderia cenocepacia]RQZ24340.1 LysE family translocator [Burkholderia sp. Bp9090]
MLHLSWLPFIATSLLIILTPGQDMVLVMSRTLSSGTRAGIVTAAGVSIGLIVHTMLATLGVGALLQASAWLYTLLKLVGALYLLYLGVMLLRSPGEITLSGNQGAPVSALRTFMQGALSNVSNPKIVLFYLAFLPQFAPADSTRPMLSIFILGVTFAGLTFLVKGPVALFAGLLSASIRRNPRILTRIHRTSGVVLLALGVKLALERQ